MLQSSFLEQIQSVLLPALGFFALFKLIHQLDLGWCLFIYLLSVIELSVVICIRTRIRWWLTILLQTMLWTLNILCWFWTFLYFRFWIVSDTHRLKELVRFKWIICDIDIPVEVTLFQCHLLWFCRWLRSGLFPRLQLAVSAFSLISFSKKYKTYH